MRLLVVLLSAFAVATPVLAQPTSEARAEADRLLQAGDAADLFDNISTDDAPTLRHRASGMVCTFTAGAPINRVIVFPSSLPRGDDVGCNTGNRTDATSTLYATRFGERTTAQEQVDGALRSVRVRFPDAREAPGPSATTNTPGLPARSSGRLIVPGEDGSPVVARVSAAVFGDWVIKLRTSGPGANVVAADLMGELMMTTALQRMLESRGASR